MSDLISRKAVLDIIQKEIDFGTEYDADYALISLKDVIAEMPTAYDVEKVVAELEQQAEQYRNRGFEHEQKGFYAMADKYDGKQCSYLHAIDIVKRGGVE